MRNPPAAPIYQSLEPADMRKSFDTLAVLVREFLNGDPQSGAWFVFRGKRGDRLKILYWEGTGMRSGRSGWRPGRSNSPR